MFGSIAEDASFPYFWRTLKPDKLVYPVRIKGSGEGAVPKRVLYICQGVAR